MKIYWKVASAYQLSKIQMVRLTEVLSSAMHQLKKVILISLLPIISIFLSVFIFEIFLFYNNYYEAPKYVYTKIHSTNYGFIDKTIAPYFSKADPDTRDIFIIGDSFTQGAQCVLVKKDFPAQLQTRIGERFKVHNLGLAGKNTADYVDIASELKLDSTDTVIIVLYDNDIHVSKQNCEQIQRQKQISNIYEPKFCRGDIKSFSDQAQNGFLRRINNNAKNFRTFQLLKESAVNISFLRKYFYRTEYQSRWTEFEAEETKWIISSLSALSDIITSKGADIRFTYYPNTNSIELSDPRHSNWKDFNSKVFDELGITIDDPYPYFTKHAGNKSMVWSLIDKHPSCDAHQIMARYVERYFD